MRTVTDIGALDEAALVKARRKKWSLPDAPVIEGYASLFGVADQSGDVVRAGAFAASLNRQTVPMLLQHKSGAIAGRWTRLAEDGALAELEAEFECRSLADLQTRLKQLSASELARVLSILLKAAGSPADTDRVSPGEAARAVAEAFHAALG